MWEVQNSAHNQAYRKCQDLLSQKKYIQIFFFLSKQTRLEGNTKNVWMLQSIAFDFFYAKD